MKYLITLILFVIKLHSHAQDTTNSHAAYIEILGNQFNQTYNYEYQLHYTKYLHVAFRAGIGAYHIKDFEDKINPDLLFPLAINGWLGNKHSVELRIGQTITSLITYRLVTQEKKRDLAMHTHFNLGYRFQKNDGGFQFRALYAPFINHNKTFRHWGGFSLGYVFK